MKSDAELIKRTLEGEWRNYAVLVRKYESKIYSYVYFMVKNREDAEEITQDTFIKAYRALRSFRGEALFSTWLLRIAHFECLTLFRRKVPTKVTIESLDQKEGSRENDPVKDLYLADRNSILAAALNQLKPDERSVITMFYYNELSIQETTEATNLSESNVKILLHRSRKKLLKILKSMGVKEILA